MGIASIAGVVGVVGLGSTVESVEVVTIEILINILIVIVTIKGNVKVIIEMLIKVLIVAVTIKLQRPRFSEILLFASKCIWRCNVILRFQRFSEAFRGFQSFSKLFRDFTFCVKMLLAYVFKMHFERIVKNQNVQKCIAVAQNVVFVLSERTHFAHLMLGLIWG